MRNELTVFENEKFGKLEVLVENGKEYFPATEIAKILGYSNPQKAIRDHCREDGCTIRSVIDRLGRTQEKKFINEGNLYRLIAKSNLPQAEVFESWVFDEVLPTIRKTGMYITDNVWDTIINDPEKLGEVLINYGKVKKEKELLEEENQIQKQLIAEYKPIKEYVDTILSSEDTMTTTQIAADYGFSAYELNKTLNEQRVVRKVGGQWILYIEHMNKGYTKSETMTVKKKDGTDKVVANTKWTQKGRLFIHNLLENLGIKANMDREKEGA
jgi:hypothetical protein